MERHRWETFKRVVGESASDVVFFGDGIGYGTDFASDWFVEERVTGNIIVDGRDRCVKWLRRRKGRRRVSSSEFRRRYDR